VFDAVVLSGGGARRLGGIDKPGIDIAGVPLLERAVLACAGAERIVVVGPQRELPVSATWARESPVGGGPVAALAAGFSQTTAEIVLVLAADLPWVAPAVPVLVAAVEEVEGAAVLIDPAGRRNLLAAAWRRNALAAAFGRLGDAAGAAMRTLYAGVPCVEVPDPHGWGQDCDTWDEVAQARERATGERTT